MTLLRTIIFILFKISYIIKQVELLSLDDLEEYDEELFTNLFIFTNKIEIRKIRIKFYESLFRSLSNEDIKNTCRKFEEKIRRLETQNIISNDVSCFI